MITLGATWVVFNRVPLHSYTEKNWMSDEHLDRFLNGWHIYLMMHNCICKHDSTEWNEMNQLTPKYTHQMSFKWINHVPASKLLHILMNMRCEFISWSIYFVTYPYCGSNYSEIAITNSLLCHAVSDFSICFNCQLDAVMLSLLFF